MPIIKSAKKRVKVSEKKNLQNRMYKSAFKTTLKKLDTAVESGDKNAALEANKDVVKALDKEAARGIIHKNAAARKKSRNLARIEKMDA